MKIFRSPIIWRLFAWFSILSLIPIAVVAVFIQNQVRENILNSKLASIEDHAAIYYEQVQADPENQQQITETMGLADEHDTFFLIAQDGTYAAHSQPTKIGASARDDFNIGVVQKLLSSNSAQIYDEPSQHIISSYRTNANLPIAVAVTDADSISVEVENLTRVILTRLFIALALAAIIAGLIVVSFLSPLVSLADYAIELGKGNYSARIDDRRMRGEFTVLASNLKVLARGVSNSIANLETRVEERTRDIERRSALLKAVADVGKAISSFRDLSELLQQTTFLIQENFGYYHAGIFLLDDHKEYAVLVAANSEGGKRMLERKHSLKVGEIGIVGYVTKNIQARIALDVGKDATYFDNPDLPETRSELALPLVASGQLFGALDVQSTEPQAFTENDISALQVLAEQIAIAIQNARLFSETEKALEASRTVFGEISRESWKKILHTQPRAGFIATPSGATQVTTEKIETNLAKAFNTGDLVLGSDGFTISMPIKVRGQSIGAIRLRKPEISESWTQDEINLALALSDQISGALESARLYQESQKRAARESLVSEISTRLNAVSQVDAILRETVQELGNTLGNAAVSFHLVDETFGKETPRNNGNGSAPYQDKGGS